MPSHHNLEAYLDAYILGVRHRRRPEARLFPSANGRTSDLTVDVYRMIRRRAEQAGILSPISCHSLRATGVRAYLDNRGTLETAQLMATIDPGPT